MLDPQGRCPAFTNTPRPKAGTCDGRKSDSDGVTMETSYEVRKYIDMFIDGIVSQGMGN